MTTELEIIIGLEIHIQLKTKSKMFCSCDNESHNIKPNTNVCPICMAVVGTLPLINKKAFFDSVLTGLALNCEIAKHTKWDRKNYFYPDLPKAYQISQYDMPLASRGNVKILLENGESKTIRINRLHLEEDAAKLVHTKNETLIDFNRAGTPLMEIVTEPDIRSAEEAGNLIRELRRIVRYLDVSDADMEKGHLRCDASISLRPKGESKLYPRTEIKNLNSFKMVEKALIYEINKQKNLWKNDEYNKEEITVLWDDELQKTKFMRDKEGAADYRYFPEPDIPEVDLTKEQIDELKSKIPTLPIKRIEKYLSLGFDYPSALFIVENKRLSDYIDQVLILAKNDPKLIKPIVKWIIGELFAILKSVNIEEIKIKPNDFFEIVKSVYEEKISRLSAKKIFDRACTEKINLSEELENKTFDNNIDIDKIIDNAILKNQKVVDEYKSGKEKVLNVLIGSIIKETKGSISPKEIIELLRKKIQ
jgi:aspartyl-tRNA(Asn)/glutamyl-tRNA(Gln) amidotransferase subunit B